MRKHIDLLLKQARSELGLIPRQFAETCGLRAEALRHQLYAESTKKWGLRHLIQTKPRIMAKVIARTLSE